MVTGLATVAAGGAIAWAFEDTRRALNGEATMTDEAVDFWQEEGLVGGLQQFGSAVSYLFE